MKINETGRIGAINNYQRQAETHRLEDRKAKRKDEVSISDTAKELLKAQQGGLDPVRAQRIEDLKSQVSAGTYRVDADKVAEKLVPFFKSFLNEK